MAAFADRFVRDRIDGFEKDMRICLTGIPHPKKRGKTTHAYFPALGACCATLDYLASLYSGRISKGPHLADMTRYAQRYLPQPDYGADPIRVLILAFRHAVAHRGVATGIWVERLRAGTGRRVTWKIYAESKSPAIQIRESRGVLRSDPPWPCPHTHRAHIYLGQLWEDVRDSGHRYAAELLHDGRLVEHFTDCMYHLYPLTQIKSEPSKAQEQRLAVTNEGPT
jgi:hypothetical protein